MTHSIQRSDEVRPAYEPPHAPTLYYFRIFTAGWGPIRFGGHASSLIGWEAYARIGPFSIRWTVPR